MEFTQNDWGQRDIINKIAILPKQGKDVKHDVIQTKNHKYPSTTILKDVNDLAKANKSPWGLLHNMTPHDAYSILTHICTITQVNISHKQKE